MYFIITIHSLKSINTISKHEQRQVPRKMRRWDELKIQENEHFFVQEIITIRNLFAVPGYSQF